MNNSAFIVRTWSFHDLVQFIMITIKPNDNCVYLETTTKLICSEQEKPLTQRVKNSFLDQLPTFSCFLFFNYSKIPVWLNCVYFVFQTLALLIRSRISKHNSWYEGWPHFIKSKIFLMLFRGSLQPSKRYPWICRYAHMHLLHSFVHILISVWCMVLIYEMKLKKTFADIFSN